LLAGLFTAPVAAAELREAADSALLDPLEASYCTTFAPKRIAEFTGGRLCARHALIELGIDAGPIAIDANRTPRWPDGATGSITHTHGFCGAVVGLTSTIRSVGVDAERVGRVTEDLDHLLFTSEEHGFLTKLDAPARARAATIIFSAKEAFYKCQYTITGKWLDFHDASLRLSDPDRSSGTFDVEAAIAHAGLAFPLRGRFVIEENLVVTGLAIYTDF
jgi:4'-phosphopantetheinyl transferase EntD